MTGISQCHFWRAAQKECVLTSGLKEKRLFWVEELACIYCLDRSNFLTLNEDLSILTYPWLMGEVSNFWFDKVLGAHNLLFSSIRGWTHQVPCRVGLWVIYFLGKTLVSSLRVRTKDLKINNMSKTICFPSIFRRGWNHLEGIGLFWRFVFHWDTLGTCLDCNLL